MDERDGDAARLESPSIVREPRRLVECKVMTLMPDVHSQLLCGDIGGTLRDATNSQGAHLDFDGVFRMLAVHCDQFPVADDAGD